MLSVVMRNVVMLMVVQPLSFLIITSFKEKLKMLFTGYIFAYRLIFIEINHRYCNINTQRENMHCQGTACTRSFEIDLTSAEDEKLECFK
jgi:hypothetical protein